MRWQVALHPARNKRAMDAGTQLAPSSLLSKGPHLIEWHRPHFRWDVPL